MRHLIMPLLVATAMVLSTAPAHADLGDQLFKLLANDGADGDIVGNSVAISGEIAIVGAVGDDDNGPDSGSAYLFDVSDPTNPVQIAKILPNDGAAEDAFGLRVAIDGAIAVVGASGDADNGSRSGSAYLFNAITGQQLFKLLPNDGEAGDQFGYGIAISGATAIVGSSHDEDNGGGSGSAYLFDTTTGRQIFKLLADDGANGDNFGRSVAISSTSAIIGAYGDDNDNGWYSGSAYLFDITTGRQLAKLLPNDGQAFDRFGCSVSISPDGIGTAIVGAWWNDDNGSNSGSAYLFDLNTGQQIAKLLPKDGAEEVWFGTSVAINGTTAIVGAMRDNENGYHSGSAYLFDAAAPGTCPWDVNGDGVVNHRDLVEVVHNLGPCDDPDNCPWDVNSDGVVDGADVSEVATHFGPCP